MIFTEQEQKLIELYKKIPTKPIKRLNIWAVELVPPSIFLIFGIYTGRQLYLIAAICMLVLFNVLRLSKQRSNVKILQSICVKLSDNSTNINETNKA